MKHIYLTLALGFMILPLNLYSQKLEDSITTDIPCYNTKELFKSLSEKYKEIPLISGLASDEAKSTMTVWMNPEDNNWTIVATKNDLSCVIGMGTDIKLLKYKTGISI